MTRVANARVVAEIKYGPTKRGKPKFSAKLPAGCIKLGPATAPIVEPQTTNDNCFARV